MSKKEGNITFKKTFITILALATAMILSLAACSPAGAPVESSEPESQSTPEITFTDADIAPYVEALNSVMQENFGIKADSAQMVRLYSEADESGMPADLNKPDSLIIRNELISDTEKLLNNKYGDYFVDPSDADCFEVTNFKSLDELRASLGNYLDSGIFEDALANNFMEFDGKLYLVRGGRGYGTESCKNGKIVSQTGTELVAEAEYDFFDEEYGKVNMTFSVTDGKLLMTAYTTEESAAIAVANEVGDKLAAIKDLESGTAGASMKALILGVDLLTYNGNRTVSDEEISGAVKDYFSRLSADELALYTENLAAVKSACDVIWTDEAADSLETAGISAEALNLDKAAAESFFKLLEPEAKG